MQSTTRSMHFVFILLILTSLLLILCQSQSTQPVRQSNIYIVKFFKATSDQIGTNITNISKFGGFPNTHQISIANNKKDFLPSNVANLVQRPNLYANQTVSRMNATFQLTTNLKNNATKLSQITSNLTNLKNLNTTIQTKINTKNPIIPTVQDKQNLNPYKNINNALIKIVANPNIPKKPAFLNKGITNTDFPNIILYHQVPINFTKNQLYRFSGIVANKTNLFLQTQQTQGINLNFVNVIFSKIKSDEEIKCIQKITKKNVQFQISCKLKIAGQFVLSIFAGQLGYSSQTIRRINEVPSSINPLGLLAPQPDSLYLDISQSNLFINWGSIAPLTKITFSQDGIQLQYILSNFHNRFRVPHADFINFDEGQARVTISHANSNDSTLLGINSYFGNKMQIKFNAISHMNSYNQSDYYTTMPQIPQHLKVNQQFSFNAIFNTYVKNQIFIVNSYHQIQKIYFNDSNLINVSIDGTIRPNTSVNLVLKFSEQGNYLLQINQDTGIAVVNQPIYVGDVYPLTPDYQDLKIQSLIEKTDTVAIFQEYLSISSPKRIKIKQPKKNSTLQQKRNFMLTLLNLLRTQSIIDPVYLDDKLSQIAQSHSDDMRKFNYFSHINIANEGPAHRAIKFGFFGAIGENIVQSDLLIQAHLSLQRSPLHYENSINKLWTRVGIGINQTLFGQYLITFQFSSKDIAKDPLTSNQLLSHQKQLIGMLVRNFPNLAQQNIQVSGLVKYWMNGIRNFPLNQYLISKSITRPLTFTTIKFTYYPDFVGDLQKSISIFGDINKYKQLAVGLGITRNENTVMECYFVFLA